MYCSYGAVSRYEFIIHDFITGENTVCTLPDETSFRMDCYAWQPDEEALFFSDDEGSRIFGFDCSGDLILSAAWTQKIENLLFIGDGLCLVDTSNTLFKIEYDKNTLTEAASIAPGSTSISSGELKYHSLSDSRGFLKSNSHGWIIDPDTFELIYSIDDACGISFDKSCVYTVKSDLFTAYPLPTSARLREMLTLVYNW